MLTYAKPFLLSLSTLTILSGCSSLFNTAGSGDYSCPGMPNGVLCKTPAAVYKSTHLDPPVTEFDTPIGAAAVAEFEASRFSATTTPSKAANAAVAAPSNVSSGPRPVREPAKVARIWIAPWVDKHDNLHLAETQYTEIKPRTWTVGLPEVAASAGYVIPHRAFDDIQAGAEAKNERSETRTSDGTPSANSQASREASALVAPPN